MVFEEKYTELKKNRNVMLWYDNLQNGSKITGDVYLRTFGLYLEIMETTPEQIIEDAKSQEWKLRNDFMGFVKKMQDRGKTGSYITRFKKVLVSWCRFNGIDAELSIVKVSGANLSPTTMNERVPLKNELKRILNTATMRGKVIIGTLSFCGLRPESLGNYDGSDAIKVGDIEGLMIKDGKVEFSVLPAVLRIRQSPVQLSKKGHSYFTFIPEQLAEYISTYLMFRIQSGENVTENSPIITHDPKGSKKGGSNNKYEGKILKTTFLERDVRDAIRSAGYRWRPYVMRAYFSTQLDVCEAKGLVSHNWREFWHGHTGDISARYSVNKVLSKEIVEEMRTAYSKCEKYLVTDLPEGISEQDSVKILRESTINAIEIYADITVSQEDRERLYSLNVDEFNEELKKLARKSKAMELNNGNRNKIINVQELENYLDRKWELVSIFPAGDRAVVKLPD